MEAEEVLEAVVEEALGPEVGLGPDEEPDKGSGIPRRCRG